MKSIGFHNFLIGILAFVTATILSACASTRTFSEAYHPLPSGESQAIQYATIPKVIKGGSVVNRRKDTVRLMRNGYVQVGYSLIVDSVGHLPDIDDVPEMLRELGGDKNAVVVVWYGDYLGSSSGYIPLYMPNTQVTTTNSNGSIYGSGGVINYYGTSTSTTNSTQMVNIPYHRDYFGLAATFWALHKPFIFGAYFKDASNTDHHMVGKNLGVELILVTRNSPAYKANFMDGDVLTAVNGISISDAETFSEDLHHNQGEAVKITFWRKGKKHFQKLNLNASN